MPPSPQGKAFVDAAPPTTSRYPPTQAAKKCGIGPRLFPVPPAESPVDGAGPLRGVKTGRRITIWNHLTRSGAPFSLDSKNRSFSSREKETGFVVLAKSAPFKTPCRAFLTPLPCSSSPHATRCAGLARGPHFCMWFARRVVAPHKQSSTRGASGKPRPTFSNFKSLSHSMEVPVCFPSHR